MESIDELEGTASSVKRKFEGHEEVVDKKREKVCDEKKELDKKRTEMDEEKEELDKKRNEMDEDKEELNKKRKEMDEEKEELNRKRKELEEEKDEMGEELKMLDKKVKELEEREGLLDIRETTIYDKEEFLEDKEVILLKKEEEICEEREGMNKSKCKMKKHEKLVNLIVDKLECPVCMEIPRSGPVPVCPNGHFVCITCKTGSCPTCRSAMGGGKSLLGVTILENIDHRCKFDLCEEILPAEDLDNHEAVCQHRTVACPKITCQAEVPLSKLVYHLLNSKNCCLHKEKFHCELGKWIQKGYRPQQEANNGSWPVKVYHIDGEDFVVFPNKSEGYYYFLPIIFVSAAKAAEYKFEIVVHERGLDVTKSDLAAKFLGNPLSIDLKKKELDIFGTSEQLMNNIRMRNNTKVSFSLSSKISKN